MGKTIAILGSTGSIGTQTLEVVRENGDIQVAALSAGANISLLEKQIREFRPRLVAVWDKEKATELKTKVADLNVEVVSGMDGLLKLAVLPEAEPFDVHINEGEIKWDTFRSGGAGGQNVNKVNSGVRLRYMWTNLSAGLPYSRVHEYG